MSIVSISGQDPRDKVFALPEICERISRSLDRKAITSCSRVSRAWNASWLPILWHTIDAGKQWHQPAFLDALGRHGDLIRILKCSRYDDISLLFSVDAAICRNLITLVLPKTTLANEADHVRLLQQNPHLHNLSLSIHDDPSSSYARLIEAVCELRFLRRLAFDENKTLQVSTLETILSKRNGSLQELSLKGTYFIKHPFGSAEEFASGLLAASDLAGQTSAEALSKDIKIESKESFGIRSLCMDSVTCMQDLVLNLGSRFPLLNRLSLRESAEVYFSKDFPARLAKRCPKIKHLDISCSEDMDDATIASLIASFPSLQTFHAAETRFGNKSLMALVEYCGGLTVLDINTTYGIQGEIVQQLLERCWGLRKLEGWDVSVNVGKMMAEAYKSGRAASAGPVVAHTDSSILRTKHSNHQGLRGQWACLELESLVLRFDYDSSEMTEDEKRLYPPSLARRFVYEQLSKLKKLKYLAIGATLLNNGEHGSDFEGEGDKDETSDSIWIDFSLRSGLALLVPLTDLHTLCLSAIDHAVEVPEIVWMSKNWPNLRTIEGLYEDDDEQVVQWLRESRPDIEIDEE
ncbi:hypothetical protein BC939DRAFT_502756 [Gamsiella multidivaricata]|uniref:uncharacterized protein n=1 Tax=Gamsiella multidivaricata TaxID=101098 RepID=UPI00221FF71E|nr:uncharacterized protein BC939DRAFT_502756 [Gamsiella multidivaricata]KAG0367425.1 hypothetical protein BGZ54_003882 [Gamsiella multidivaricata]KAI7824330.1 hypothetical protein BC939DRAFT_502756 [Gamsiella multidivaricata]